MADSMPWFRYYSETARDRKFAVIARMTEIDRLTILGAWSLLLCMANDSPIRGSLYATETRPFTNADIADDLGMEIDATSTLLDALRHMEMLGVDENSALFILNWDKRQFVSDNSTERSRESRERRKSEMQQLSNVAETLQQHPQRQSTESDTETETETEQESGAREFLAEYLEIAAVKTFPKSDWRLMDRLTRLFSRYGRDPCLDCARWTWKRPGMSLSKSVSSMETALGQGWGMGPPGGGKYRKPTEDEILAMRQKWVYEDLHP